MVLVLLVPTGVCAKTLTFKIKITNRHQTLSLQERKYSGYGRTIFWCLNVLEDAIARHGAPEIINTDHGSH